MLIEAGCSTLSVEACHLPGQTPGGQLSRQAQFTKSDIFTQPLSSAGIGTLLSGTEKFLAAGGASGGSGGVAFDALGGAVNRVAPGATAYVHRAGFSQPQPTPAWPGSGGPSAIGRQESWRRSLHASAHRYASGQAYQNYID